MALVMPPAFASVAIYACPENRVAARSSSVQARFQFERLDAGTAYSASAAELGPTQPQDGLRRNFRTRRSVRCSAAATPESPAVEKSVAGDPVHKVLIVGAGIAGLSAAVGLHRVGVEVRVLEQSSSLRSSGASLTLWRNAWLALDSLGVSDDLRESHVLCSGMALYDRSGKLLKNIQFDKCPGGPHEVRAVERKLLINALAAQLPLGTIQFGSRVRTIHRKSGEGVTKVELENGSVIFTKVLVGCDGANSVVARWMGFPSTRYVGHIGIRGVAEYSNGHGFGTTMFQYLGNGKRYGVVPFSDSKVYWFHAFKSSSPGPKVTDQNLVKAEALRAVQDGWPDKMEELVTKSPVESISRAALSDRWNILGVTPALVQEGVSLAGDAMHPMTPNLGQGGCTAIEDGVVLARTLGSVLSQDGGAASIQKALEEYAALRQRRTFPITIKSFLIGIFFTIEFPPFVYFRDNFALPFLLNSSAVLAETFFDVGNLPTSKVNTE